MKICSFVFVVRVFAIGLTLAVPVVSFGNAMLSSKAGGFAGSQSCSNSGTTSASCSLVLAGVTTLPPPLPYTGSAFANANASYGHVFSKVGVTATEPIGFDMDATASFLDTLTVLGGSGNGYIDYTFTGSLTTVILSASGFTFQQNAFPQETFFPAVNGTIPVNYETSLYPFTYGVPFTIQVAAIAQAIGPGDESGNGLADISLDHLSVFNQSLNPIGSFSIASDSGTAYSTKPEPSSIVLLGTLTTFVAIITRKIRRAQ